METQSHSNHNNPLNRRLTKFMCQELLFDYQMECLDAERKRAVEEFLTESRECQEHLKSLRAGIEYCRQLGEVKIESVYTDKFILQQDIWWRKFKRILHWSLWPQPARWAVEAAVVSVFIMAIVYYTPWKKLGAFDWKSAQEMAVVDFSNNMDGAEPVEDTESELAEGETDMHDEGEMQLPADKTKTAHTDENDEAPVAVAVKPSPVVVVTPPNVVTPPPTPKVAVNSAKPEMPTEAELHDTSKTTALVASGTPNKAPMGLLYRLIMTLPDVDPTSEQITAKIQELGGAKAGNVELGWKKDNGRYYHFTFPQANEQQLMTYLQSLGPVRISKTKHERVMPAGQLRFILWVEPKAK